jgi:OOP family OmpA-OmpF porin
MRLWIGLLPFAVVVGCGAPVEFQGKTTLAIVGTAPPAVAVAPPRVEVRDNKIEIREKIQFDYDKATIKEASFGLLREIADVITKNPHIKRIQIEGHASSEGSASHNKTLSDARARAVMAWLTTNGIAAGRLSAIGYGVERPIADNATETGRETNRRVEFEIVEQDVTQRKVEVDASGVEKVVEEKHENINATPAAAEKAPPSAMAGAKGAAE